MTNKLDQLRSMSTIVADTGDIAAVRRLRPEDCTTNPSIVLKALSSLDFEGLVAERVRAAVAVHESLTNILIDLTVAVGAELAGLVVGRISTEVDARLSYDVDGSVRRAHELLAAYDRRGIASERVLIKLAATWEGIRAAEILQRQGVDCNLTLLFGLTQARACADAGAFLVSPFVGRITDWHKAKSGQSYQAEQDPGVESVRGIYHYYKAHGISTVVMAASFRSTSQIEALAGCDRLTIAPTLLDELAAAEGALERKLVPAARREQAARLPEASFRWEMNEDEMASDLLAQGIRKFHADALELERRIGDRLDTPSDIVWAGAAL